MFIHLTYQHSNTTMHMLTTLAYCTEGLHFSAFIIKVLKFKGMQWHPYDKMFKEHVAKHPNSGQLLTQCSIASSTLTKRWRQEQCISPDHQHNECALNSLEQSQLPTPPLTPFSESQETRLWSQQAKPKSAPPLCNEGQCWRYQKECYHWISVLKLMCLIYSSFTLASCSMFIYLETLRCTYIPLVLSSTMPCHAMPQME